MRWVLQCKKKGIKRIEFSSPVCQQKLSQIGGPASSSKAATFMKKNGLPSCSNEIKFRPEKTHCCSRALRRWLVKNKISTWDEMLLKFNLQKFLFLSFVSGENFREWGSVTWTAEGRGRGWLSVLINLHVASETARSLHGVDGSTVVALFQVGAVEGFRQRMSSGCIPQLISL